MSVPALLQAIYEAFREKRLDDALSSLGDEFHYILHVPETVSPGGAEPRDKASTAEFFARVMETYDFLSYDPGPIIISGDHASAQPHVRLRHVKTGKELETKVSHRWHIKDGKVVALEESHDVPRLEAFIKSVKDADG